MKNYAFFFVFLLILSSNISGKSNNDSEHLIKEVMEGIKEGVEKLEFINNAVTDFKLYGKFNGFNNTWLTFSDNYENSAKLLNQTAPPLSFDPQRYSIKVGTLNCGTKDVFLQKINEYLKVLEQDQRHSFYLQTQLKESERQIEYAKKVIGELIALHEKYMTVDIFNQQVQLDWYDLDHKVLPALGQLHLSIIQYRKRVEIEYGKSRIAVSNLKANIPLLNKVNCERDFLCENISSSTFQTGGLQTPFCGSIDQIKNIKVSVRLNSQTNTVVMANLTAQYIEHKMTTSCQRGPQTYTMAYSLGSSSVSGGNIRIVFSPLGSNRMLCNLLLTGLVNDKIINSTLSFSRSQTNQNWAFNVNQLVNLNRL